MVRRTDTVVDEDFASALAPCDSLPCAVDALLDYVAVGAYNRLR